MNFKKITTILALLATIYFPVTALELHEYKVFNRMANESTQRSLTRYLQTSDSQTEMLHEIFILTERKMQIAIEKEDENAAEKAMWFNLANMKNVLSNQQYKKYLVAINLSVYSRNYEILAEK